MSEEEIKECLDSLYYQDDFCTISYDKLKDYIIKLKTQLQQKENIIKEAREYIKYQLEHLDFEKDTKAKMLGAMVLVMLDKENK